MKWTMLLGFAGATLLTGCATTLTSVPLSPHACKDAAANTIPYYLPHPYLLVTRNFAVAESVKKSETSKQTELARTTEKTAETTTASVAAPAPNVDVIAWQIVYLPDLDQKYGLRFRRGWGKYESAITLVDGWKLAGVNITAEAQAAETISAIGSAVKDIAGAAIPGLPQIPTPSKGPTTDKGKEFAPPATKQVEFWLYDLGDLGKADAVFHWTAP